MTAIVEFTALCVTLVLAIIAGSMRFGGLENRINTLEDFSVIIRPKLDRIAESLARIEGRLEGRRNVGEDH
jgi:hypothetical protein